MAKKFLTPIELVPLQSDPSNSQSGTFYFNSNLKKIRYFDGNVWGSLQKEYELSHTISNNTSNVIDEWNATAFTTLEYTLQIKQGTKLRSSKLMVLTNQSLFYYTEYSIIEIGGQINGLQIDTIKTDSNGQLVIQISDATSNNAQVTIVRSTIA